MVDALWFAADVVPDLSPSAVPDDPGARTHVGRGDAALGKTPLVGRDGRVVGEGTDEDQ